MADNAAGAADSAILRRKAGKTGMNYEDTLMGGGFGATSLGSGTLLGRPG